MNYSRIIPSISSCAVAALLASAALPVAAQENEASVPTLQVEEPAPTPAPEAPAAEAPAAEPEAPAAEAPAPETPAAETPAAEAPAAEQPAAPEIVTEKFGDWEKRCTADQTNCFIYQLARDQAGNPVAEVTIVTLPEGDSALAGATIVTPLGTLLNAGLIIQVDSGQARKYDYGWCTRSGCFARFGLEADYITNLKRGNRAIMQLASVSAPERPITLNVSLTGFTAAFDSLPEREQ